MGHQVMASMHVVDYIIEMRSLAQTCRLEACIESDPERFEKMKRHWAEAVARAELVFDCASKAEKQPIIDMMRQTKGD
jgi:hypothetical protein